MPCYTGSDCPPPFCYTSSDRPPPSGNYILKRLLCAVCRILSKEQIANIKFKADYGNHEFKLINWYINHKDDDCRHNYGEEKEEAEKEYERVKDDSFNCSYSECLSCVCNKCKRKIDDLRGKILDLEIQLSKAINEVDYYKSQLERNAEIAISVMKEMTQ